MFEIFLKFGPLVLFGSGLLISIFLFIDALLEPISFQSGLNMIFAAFFAPLCVTALVSLAGVTWG